MGIFSLFGKKDRPPETDSGSVRKTRAKREDGSRVADAGNETAREQQAQDQRQAARATALKIDRIESEMSSEFVGPETRVAPAQSSAKSAAKSPPQAATATPAGAPAVPDGDASPATETGQASGLFPHDVHFDTTLADAAAEDVPLFEEAAILFANGQAEMVEHLLRDAIEADDLGSAAITAWAMLFDLYQIDGNQAQFETLSIDYASRFETSPPAWVAPAAPERAAAPLRAPAVPSVIFSDRLDASIVKTLERARTLADRNTVLRLEFMRITEVDPIGCGLLLRVLKQLQKSGIDLILVGAPELVAKIRAILEVGRRDETEAPWLLLMELLALLNQESAFEEASIDYCVTFEVSPPAFVAPKSKVTTAMEEPAGHPVEDVFRMPAVVQGKTTALVAALTAFATNHNPALVDCTHLTRVDVNAAGQLLAGLSAVAGDGRSIEFINVNHLVAALFNVVGLKQIIRIGTRRI